MESSTLSTELWQLEAVAQFSQKFVCALRTTTYSWVWVALLGSIFGCCSVSGDKQVSVKRVSVFVITVSTAI
jgi:hypothetical protein